MLGGAEGQRHDRQDRIEAAVSDMEGSVHYVEVIVSVDAAPFIGDGGARVVAHAAGSRLMLACAQAEAGRIAPDAPRPASPQPLLGALPHELRRAHGLRVCRAGKAGHRQAPAVAHTRIYGDTGLRVGNLLYRPHDLQVPRVVTAHELLVLRAPARQIGRKGGAPEDYGQL